MKSFALAMLLALVACQPLRSDPPPADATPDGACAMGRLGDDANCGSCGRRCAVGDTCVEGACVLALPAPRPLAPQTGTITRATRPRLRWALAPGADGARVTLCRDRAMTDGCSHFDATGTASDPEMPLTPGVWYWRLVSRAGQVIARAPSATWRLTVGTAESALGSTLDIDGDGRTELAIAASRALVGAGRVSLYREVNGRDVPAPFTSRRGVGSGQFGDVMTQAGDVNRDGYADLLVGAFEGNEAALFLGGPIPFGTAPTTLAGGDAFDRLGSGVAGLGDINGDGFDDVAVAARAIDGGPGVARVHLGGPEGLSREPSTTLTTRGATSVDVTVAAAGDVNGDGFDDVALGVHGASGNAGVVDVYHGGPAGLGDAPASPLVGADVAGRFGLRIAAAGDVNGDGYGDLFVGAPDALDRRGKVVVFHGGASGLRAAATTIEGPAVGAVLGRAVARGVDLDGDGYPELMVSAQGHPVYVGSLLVYRGGPSGVTRAPWLTRLGLDGVDSAYPHVILAADVNHDGRPDVVTSSPGAGSNHGRVYVYLNAPGGLATMPVPVSGSDGAQALFGRALACAAHSHRLVDAPLAL